MSSKSLLLAILLCLLFATHAISQSQNPPKQEVAAEFVSLSRDDFNGIRTEPGFGGRFTYNVTRNIGIEAVAYFFPRSCFDCLNNGRITEVVGGLKAGKRFDTWGLFAKARPGIVSFSKGHSNIIDAPQTPAFPFVFEVKPLTNFAADLGAVLEFYPSRRIVTRFDAGDTIISHRQRTQNSFRFDPMTNTFSLVPLRVPGRTTHNFQFSASVGFRW